MILTVGLVSVILGTASAAQNVGPMSAIAVGAYIILAGFWAAPVSGASMNPARSFGPDLATGDFSNYWVYIVGPIVGGLIAVGFAFILRGRCDVGGAKAAQGELGPLEVPAAAGPARARLNPRAGRQPRSGPLKRAWGINPPCVPHRELRRIVAVAVAVTALVVGTISTSSARPAHPVRAACIAHRCEARTPNAPRGGAVAGLQTGAHISVNNAGVRAAFRALHRQMRDGRIHGKSGRVSTIHEYVGTSFQDLAGFNGAQATQSVSTKIQRRQLRAPRCTCRRCIRTASCIEVTTAYFFGSRRSRRGTGARRSVSSPR